MSEEKYAQLGRACESHGLAGFHQNGGMWFQPPEDLIEEQAFQKGWDAALKDRPSRISRVADEPDRAKEIKASSGELPVLRCEGYGMAT